MTGFNHAAVGCLIGAVLPLPIAIPAAAASHFALDMLPHYGIPHHHRDQLRFWKYFFTVDFLVVLGAGIFAVVTQHYVMTLCGLIAVGPDFIWVARVVKTRSFNFSEHKSKFAKWHAGIQHFERPWGLFVELPLSVLFGYLVFQVFTA